MTLTWRSPGRQAPFHRSMQGKNELEQSTPARRTKTRRMSGSHPSYTLLADPHLIMDVRLWHKADMESVLNVRFERNNRHDAMSDHDPFQTYRSGAKHAWNETFRPRWD